MIETAATNAALKEWAIVCQALADGRQTLLIRKGGIQEIKRGFEVTYRSFWLFPTYVHQKTADLVAAVHEEFRTVHGGERSAGTVPIHLYATVEDVLKVMDVEQLRRLEGYHVLSWECVASRFHYRNTPGVHLLLLRVYRRPEPILLHNQPWYDGCVSWVELDRSLDPIGCVPVLSNTDFAARTGAIRRQLTASGAGVPQSQDANGGVSG